MPTLCRDCLLVHQDASGPCAGCLGSRLLSHAELTQLTIAHVDCDAFYASVEKRDNPGLQDKPLLIGHEGGRGVVTTACYIARRFGCRSAMPMFKALQLCPEATVIAPDMAKYKEVSAQIRVLIGSFTKLFEPVSIDEAYLDLGPKTRAFEGSPALALARLALEVERRTGVTISIGLSFNKFLAKLASDRHKPRGFSVIGRNEALDYLAPLSVTKIHGVGAATASRMEQAGWRSIGDLQKVTERELIARFGLFGRRLFQFVNGEDSRQIKACRIAKSISAETTFRTDMHGFDDLRTVLSQLCERLSRGLAEKGLAGRTVTLKLKTSDFKVITRRSTLRDPSDRRETIFAAAERLLKEQVRGERYRLIGVGMGDFCPSAQADPPSLLDGVAFR